MDRRARIVSRLQLDHEERQRLSTHGVVHGAPHSRAGILDWETPALLCRRFLRGEAEGRRREEEQGKEHIGATDQHVHERLTMRRCRAKRFSQTSDRTAAATSGTEGDQAANFYDAADQSRPGSSVGRATDF